MNQITARGKRIMNEGLHINPDSWLSIPGYHPWKEYILIEVEGNAMAPTVLHSDILICQRHINLETIPNCSMVVLKTNNTLIINRLIIHPNPLFFWMENDHIKLGNDYVKIKKTDIMELLVVRGKLNTNAVFQKKCVSLEKDIFLLKKGLSKYTS